MDTVLLCKGSHLPARSVIAESNHCLQHCGQQRVKMTAFEMFRRYCKSCLRRHLCKRATLSERIQESLQDDEKHLLGEICSFVLIQPSCLPRRCSAYTISRRIAECWDQLSPLFILCKTWATIATECTRWIPRYSPSVRLRQCS